jgi:hypothetical protein
MHKFLTFVNLLPERSAGDLKYRMIAGYGLQFRGDRKEVAKFLGKG